MNVIKAKKAPASTLLFSALADPTRLRVLCLLRGGERCVCDLVQALRISQPKISRHLAYLRRSGWVVTRREGLWIFYRLTSPASRTHKKLLECLDACGDETSHCKRDGERLACCSNGPSRCC